MSNLAKQIISSSLAPAALGPYSQAVRVDKTVYLSGNLGMNPSTGNLVEGGIVPETHQCFKNIGNVLAAAGANYTNVVKTTVFLADMADFASLNSVYAEYFTSDFPARSTFQVAALPKGARVEIECVAVLGE